MYRKGEKKRSLLGVVAKFAFALSYCLAGSRFLAVYLCLCVRVCVVFQSEVGRRRFGGA